jgi:phosphoribosylformylglycinamidine (FGAM) synthase-like amidotransferase family enzyme
MRYWVLGVAVAALSVGATAQNSAWGFFGGPGQASGAGVQAADGSQLLIKCDKPGKKQVFAVVVATTNQARPLPSNQFESFPVTLRMDDKAAWDDNWRFNDKFAMAVDQGNTRSLTRLLEQLADAKSVDVRLKPIEHAVYNTSFNVAGAREAIAKVYSDCGDKDPLG